MTNRKTINYKDGWSLNNYNNNLYLQSNLLSAKNFKHAFFTKKVISNNPEQLNDIISHDSSIHYLNQVHGNKIIQASESNNIKQKKADGLISNKCLQGLWIYSADCMPILLGDTEMGFAGAIHCGWRGLENNIINQALKKMKTLGCKAKNIVAAIGPAISGANYQVDLKLAGLLIDKMNLSKETSYENIIREEYIQHDIEPNKIRIDIRMIAERNLISEGIPINNISRSKQCTYTDKNLFESWRRDAVKSRQWSIIVSR